MLAAIHWFSLICLLRATCVVVAVGRDSESINIVATIDEISSALSLIKSHSLIESTQEKDKLYFRFLVTTEAVLESHQLMFTKLFPTIAVEYKVFTPPAIFAKFSNESYEKSVVFSRLFVPTEFLHIDKFLYLDNDIVGNVDIQEAYGISLYNRASKRYVSSGFTIEHSRHHANWVKTHFNMKHPLYLSALQSHRNQMRYLNSGVWLCNATEWRRLGLTEKATDIIERSFTEQIYQRNVTSDQEVFYLLLHKDDMVELPSRFNMGVHSYNRFVDFMHMNTGLVHFAAIDKSSLCTRPLRMHALLSSGTLLYFLAVAKSLTQLYFKNIPDMKPPSLFVDCERSLESVMEVVRKEDISKIPKFNGGLGNFTFQI